MEKIVKVCFLSLGFFFKGILLEFFKKENSFFVVGVILKILKYN